MADTVQSNPPNDTNTLKNLDTLIQNAFKSIVKCTKRAQSFPSGHENSLLVASPTYINSVAATGEKVMGLVDKLLNSQNVTKSMSKLYLEGQKDILVEANDKLLEDINNRIDVMAGTKSASAIGPNTLVVKESWNKNVKASNVWQEVSHAKKSNFNMFSNNQFVIERPQLKFKDKVDNDDKTIFEPKIKEKPNALKPLAILLERYDDIESFSHPYEYELDLFTPKDHFLLCKKEAQLPRPLTETPLIFVDKPERVKQLLEDLKQQKEFAVDLEYHSYRSFQGYTCLMQISTHDKDYIVDTLDLRDELQVLNEVFTDNKIIKVFHGAESDIKWLQKDFGIYVVGMFDTYQACKFLPMPRQSLAYLLKHYCGIDSDKTFQLFDWRKRPLPEQAINYARSDTHYLLYIFDCMVKDLIDASHGKKNLLLSTFSNSVNTCKLRYEKPRFFEDGFMNIFRSHNLLNNQQKYALKELYKWRDSTARAMDESTGYILPNHMLLQIAQSIPRDVQGIFACCNPVPQPVKQHVLAIHAIILKARLQPLTRPVEKSKDKDELVKRDKKTVLPPHDSMDSENYKGLPPVFGDKLSIINARVSKPTDVNNKPPKIKLFFEETKKSLSKTKKPKQKRSTFETPYTRFLKSKEYAKALAAKCEKENDEKTTANAPDLSKIKIEGEVKSKKNEPEVVALKTVKIEENVEMEKEKRKKMLREREEEEEEQDKSVVDVQPKKKKIKLEDKNKGTKVKKKKVKTELPNIKQDVEKDNQNKSDVPKVDYSKVNFNKYLVKNKKNNNRGNKKGKQKHQ